MGGSASCAIEDGVCCTGPVTATVKTLEAYAEPQQAADEPLTFSSTSAGEDKRESEDTYVVVLDKSGGRRIGIDVDHLAQPSSLPVTSVKGGVVEQWNRDFPELQVKRGHTVIAVNGVKGSVAALLERCKLDSVLTITLRRT